MNKQIKILNIILFLLIIVGIVASLTLFSWFKLNNENIELKSKLKQFGMYYKNENLFESNLGIVTPDFFCIVVENKTYSQVEETFNDIWQIYNQTKEV